MPHLPCVFMGRCQSCNEFLCYIGLILKYASLAWQRGVLQYRGETEHHAHILILCGTVITWSIFFKILQNTSHSSPIRTRYYMYCVVSNSHLYSTLVTAVMYFIQRHIRPRYNGTWQYQAIWVYVYVLHFMIINKQRCVQWKNQTQGFTANLSVFRYDLLCTLSDEYGN